MTIRDVAQALELEILAGEEGLSRRVTGCYIGDLLSWVMGRAASDCVWITVMGNVNSVAVAKLAELGCILLCESASLDADAKEQADRNAIPVLRSREPAFPLALRVAELPGMRE